MPNDIETKSPPPPLKRKESTSKVEVEAKRGNLYNPDPPQRKRMKLKNKRLLEENSSTQSNL